eukprot:jgi/Undpi1/9779/HiC_scaffold_27.g12235.m1
MAFYKFVSIVACGAVLLLLGAVDACSCAAVSGGLCEYVETSDVVLRATVLSRSEQTDINDDITYTVSTTALYKEEPDTTYSQEIGIVTGGNSAACGVNLNLGEEYLLGLYRSGANVFEPDQEGQLRVSLCDLVMVWSSVSDEDEATLETGCEEDLCDGSCSEFQECLFYTDSSTEEYYCADVCDPNPCGDGEMCSLLVVQCFRAPCPPLATCSASSD